MGEVVETHIRQKASLGLFHGDCNGALQAAEENMSTNSGKLRTRQFSCSTGVLRIALERSHRSSLKAGRTLPGMNHIISDFWNPMCLEGLKHKSLDSGTAASLIPPATDTSEEQPSNLPSSTVPHRAAKLCRRPTSLNPKSRQSPQA